jgi:NAD(P)-dependent dehydrogenase (short-subunit alcohol dehydrogenase family)
MSSPPQHIEQPPRTLILTGASRGIGHATVKRFSSAGFRVITCSRHAFPEDCPWEMGPEDHLQLDLADPEHIPWAAGPEDHIQVDLSNPADTARAVAEMRERLPLGKLDALVNNAAISPKGSRQSAVGNRDEAFPIAGSQLPLTERLDTLTTAPEVWRHVFEVNFFSTIWLAQGLVAELAAAHGAIVNVTSIAGSRVHPFAGAAYATSKAALAALTREMAADMGPLGIRVNAIAPGEIDTAILSPGTEKLVESIPMRRLGAPEEVAKAIYYLCTDQSSYVTGAELHINGGQHV